MRGEQYTFENDNELKKGSPPLARGTVICGFLPFKFCGITPACAGNRPVPSRPREDGRDHPRLRGEQRSLSISELSILGSPPLARGTE